ncbi:hypothetical protein, variant [Aphanomyces invadans]|uniref:PRA1 family protein n=1 Tax=Aphanomyces invadans TaxID=157072 RepID=A0A024U656_9STRA|nr:hypothetical protein, variant [Aphanomyces invadans]ETW01710.1 hypothetical protein, variant [Aphanomyces invadans]|eukprot:XP_008869558.1 hypothetical protein, variant [Aphanomyces invadans]
MPSRPPLRQNMTKSPLDRIHLLRLQVRDLMDLNNIRGFFSFFGFGEDQPFLVPQDRCELECRTKSNMAYFSVNYFVITCLIGFQHALLNPIFMIVLTVLAAGWAYCNYLTAHESPGNPVIILGGPTTPMQRDTCMALGKPTQDDKIADMSRSIRHFGHYLWRSSSFVHHGGQCVSHHLAFDHAQPTVGNVR